MFHSWQATVCGKLSAVAGHHSFFRAVRSLEFRLSALMDSDLAWVNGKSARYSWCYTNPFKRSIISGAIYHLPFPSVSHVQDGPKRKPQIFAKYWPVFIFFTSTLWKICNKVFIKYTTTFYPRRSIASHILPISVREKFQNNNNCCTEIFCITIVKLSILRRWYSSLLFVLLGVSMAQWLGRWTSHLAVVGSTPGPGEIT